MKWLEIIELRSLENNNKCEMMEKDLNNLMDVMDLKVRPTDIKIYKHGAVQTDLSVHLLYDSENADINGSQLGLNLVSALREFGLVNHSIWFERNGK